MTLYEKENQQKMFSHFITKQNIPHLILYGPSSSGKSLFIHTYAPQLFKEKILEINSCDEHGIEIIREKIKNFSKVIGMKLIIFDDFHYQNNLAQSALRRIVEDFSVSTRFCFITNNIQKVIEPIRSRCMIMKFSRLSESTNLHLLREEHPDVSISDEELLKLIKINDRDTRVISQSLKYNGNPLSKTHVPIANVPIANVPIINIPIAIGTEGINIGQYLQEYFQTLLESNLTDSSKCSITKLLNECDTNITNGGDEYLNMSKLQISLKKYT